MVVELLATGLAGGAMYLVAAARVIRQYERGLVFRLGRLRPDPKLPGFHLVIPGVDRLQKVNMQIVTLPIPAQEGITRDNVTVRVDAVVYFRVVDPADAVVRVEDYRFAVSQMAQTSLRSIIGKSELDDLLASREQLNQGLAIMIDSPAVEWGVNVDRVEIKDVSLPETMKRSMARQAEADRERRARVINADAELQASKKLAEAATHMEETPAALQLRLLQTVMGVSAEKNSTLVLPIPVELLRFLERSTPPAAPVEHPVPEGRGSAAGRAADDVRTDPDGLPLSVAEQPESDGTRTPGGTVTPPAAESPLSASDQYNHPDQRKRTEPPGSRLAVEWSTDPVEPGDGGETAR